MPGIEELIAAGTSPEETSPAQDMGALLREGLEAQSTDAPKPPAASSAKEDDAPPPTTDTTQTDDLRDPPFVNSDKGTPPATDPDKTGASAAPKTDPEKDTPNVFSHLETYTSGRIKSEDDFREVMDHYNELLDKEEKGFEPQFRSDQHKLAYEMLSGVKPGTEIDVARRNLRTLSIDTAKLSGKDLLFEAFLLDPENSDLTPEKAQEYFEADFQSRFSDVEHNLLQKRALEKEERKAKELIQGTQDKFLKSSTEGEKTGVVDEKTVQAIKKASEGFAGIKLAFTENAEDKDLLTIEASDEELASLEHHAQNPTQWWKDFVSQFETENGYDYNAFVRNFYELTNINKVKQLTYEHGLKQGQQRQINKDTNFSASQSAAQKGRTPASQGKEPGSIYEAWAGAQGKSQKS